MAEQLMVEPVGPFGAMVRGAAVTADASPELVEALRRLIDENLVIVLRGQATPNDDDLAGFLAHFGTAEPPGISEQGTRPGHPEIVVISNIEEHGSYGLGAQRLEWHTDQAWHERISEVGCLEAVEVPDSGGETLFCNMHAVWDRLAPEMQDRLGSLRALHRVDSGRDTDRPVKRKEAVHPMVATNPHTGRRSPYASPFFTEAVLDLSPEEGDCILREIYRDVGDPTLTVEHHWQAGDMALWDEVALLHCRRPFDGSQRRLMRQVCTQFQDADAPFRPFAMTG